MPKVAFARVPSPLEDIIVKVQLGSGAHDLYILGWDEGETRGKFVIDPAFFRWHWCDPAHAALIDDPIIVTENSSNRPLTRNRLSKADVDDLMLQRDKLSDSQIAALLALVLRGEVK